MVAKYVIGIDLGTTNSALAYAALDTDILHVQVLPIPQLVAAVTVEPRTLLPSFLYLAQEHEVQARSFDLLKAKGRGFVVGELARRQSAEMPDRTVLAAKSCQLRSQQAVDQRTSRFFPGTRRLRFPRSPR